MTEPVPPQGGIAIVGMAGRFPGAASLAAFWRTVQDGAEALEAFSDTDLDAAGVPQATRADPRYVRSGSPLAGALQFDAGFFGLTPREAELLDPQHRIFLELAWEAMEQAGYGPGTPAGVVGVYASASMNTYLPHHILRDPARAASAGGYQLMLGNDKDFLPTRVSYKLDLRGPSMAVQTACSSSLVAVEAACRALRRGACDMALAGGVSVFFPERAGYLFQEGMIFSPDGHCRPFDQAAAGTRPGAGAGIVVLKRLEAALADGDTIQAVISGIAVNNDGAGKIGYTAPSIDGQAEVIAMAQALAGVTPDSITYVEAHGTGTTLGDPIEIAALTRVFGRADAAPGFCRLGALKANIGHLDVAAGIAGLIKTVLALQHRELPPLANLSAANPALGLQGGPFSVSPTAAPWISDSPRRAGISSFGIGGTNAHAVLEEAPPPPDDESPPAETPELLLLSAKTATALHRAGEALAAHLIAHPGQRLADIAWTLRVGRKPFAHRRALVASSHAQAAAALRAPQPASTAVHEGGDRPVAFLFSGQGSQHAGMGHALYAADTAYRDAIDRCAALFARELGLDIRSVMFGEDDAALARTDLAQPALFSVHHALGEMWRRRGIVPAAMLGHSIGEYAACVRAGVMSLSDAARVVAARGRLMAALPDGGMAAVFAPPPALSGHLAAEVEIAAYNGPALCTIAGPSAALAETLVRLAAAGLQASPLPTSHAFHSAMMEGALAPFTALLSRVALAPPAIPYISNLTGTWITPDQATSPAYYADHLRHAVRFADGMRTLAADPALCFLELGPGQSLTALARANLPPARAAHVIASLPPARARHQAAARAVLEATRQRRRARAAIDPAAASPAAPTAPRRRVPLPTYPFERQLYRVTPPPADRVAPAGQAAQPRCYAPVWARDDAAPSAPLHGTWLVLGPPGALTNSVLAALGQAGAEPFQVDPDPSGYGPAFAAALGATCPAGVLLLAGLAGAGGQALYHMLVACAAALETRLPQTAKARVQVILATTGAQSVLDERVTDPSAALPLGPVLSLPAELPGLTMRAVDLPPAAPTAQAAWLVREARAGVAGAEIAWRGGRRWLRRYDPMEPEAGTIIPRHRGVILITGGLSGIGLALAVRLARAHEARLLLTGRRALPPRTTWDHAPPPWARAAIAAIRDIESAGGEVITAHADATDAEAMQAAIATATARWGPLNGVIHAAGNPGAGKLTLLQTEADLAATLAPKLGGLSVLTDLLANAELDFVALTSSLNAVVPVAGAGDYAAANLVLDRFAEAGPHPPGWRHVVAIAWGAWAEIGMAARLAASRAPQAAPSAAAIPPDTGLDLFFRILASGRNRVVVTCDDRPRLLATAAEPASSPNPPPPSPAPAAPQPHETAGHARPALSTRHEPPTGAMEQTLAAIWTDLIGVTGIGVNDDFFELGGHSLLATRVLARIGQTLDVRLTLRDLFDAPTIRTLRQKIDAALTPPDREEFLL